MGYSTEFTGKFQLDKQMNDCAILDILNAWHDGEKGSPIDGYCQWVLTKDRKAIQWDGNEKFYDYEEWLIAVSNMLHKKGYELSGEVEYQGEETGDCGKLVLKDGKVTNISYRDSLIKCPHCGKSFRRT
jgi:hypothetical protein